MLLRTGGGAEAACRAENVSDAFSTGHWTLCALRRLYVTYCQYRTCKPAKPAQSREDVLQKRSIRCCKYKKATVDHLDLQYIPREVRSFEFVVSFIGKVTNVPRTNEPHVQANRALKVVIDQTGNRRSEDGEVERAPGNRQQKHMFVVSTDMFCKRLQCIYGAATRMMCSCVHASPPAPSHHHRITCSSTTIYRQACSRGGRR